MKSKHDSAGIFIPPPIYLVTGYLIADLLQHFIPVKTGFPVPVLTKAIGWISICFSLVLGVTAVFQFHRSRTTHLTFRPVSALQTTGLYSISRNPMYLGLFLFYTGFSLLAGNWWHLIVLPVLILIFQKYIIKHEEQYLERRFGRQYLDYKKKVRRWI